MKAAPVRSETVKKLLRPALIVLTVLVVPAVNEVLKAITAIYTAEESATNRVLISEDLVEQLNDAGLYVTDVNIIDFDFSDAFINAIEEKQVAQQQLLKAETEKQTAITNAEAEAEANRSVSASLTDQIIQNKTVEKWDGKLPTVTGGSGTIISLPGAN